MSEGRWEVDVVVPRVERVGRLKTQATHPDPTPDTM